jgi:large subunit ribosomal protein L28
MSKVCDVCAKGTMSGNAVSHSNRKTRRTWSPNIQKVHAVLNGRSCRLRVCTRCLRSGLVQRAL